MEDRLVQYPNRVRLVQVDGQPGVYDIEAVPGTVTANGTPLNKATLLSDAVATLVNNAATPNEALKYLAERVQPIKLGGTGADTVADALNNLGISDALKIQTVSPSNWTVPANSARGGEIKGTITGYEGYKPIVYSCYCINSYGVLIINAWITGSYVAAGGGFTWHIDARNVTSSSVKANFTLRILWIKNNILG